MERLLDWKQQDCFQVVGLRDRGVTELSQGACMCDPTRFGRFAVVVIQHTTMEERNKDVPQDVIVTKILDGVNSFP